jgi:hypothetical protein
MPLSPQGGFFIVGGSKIRKEPTPGQLRDPITLMRSMLRPDGGAGFDQSVRKYADVWAQVWTSNASVKNGENQGSNVTHELIMRRNKTFTPSINDYLTYDDRMFKVMFIREINFKHRWWVVFAQEEGNISQFDMTNVDTGEKVVDPNPYNGDEPRTDDFPMWTRG